VIRLQKFLSEAGACSRRKGEAHILAGNVTVNGAVVVTLGTKVDPETDMVHLNGLPVGKPDQLIYVMLNKPEGIVASCEHRGEPVVTDLVDLPQRLFPVGRLDKDSTGLLLMTNDGRIHHRLSHPSFDHEKEYDVTVQWPLADQALAAMQKGMPLSGVMTRPARVHRISGNRFRIVLKEGKNRQIRRMVNKVGNRVVRLHRIRVADLKLGGLAKGSWRHLRPGETRRLLDRLQLKASKNTANKKNKVQIPNKSQ
jgi:pseudouridine synthase